MARAIPASRFQQLVEVATGIFIQRGYRRTQMADVAQGLGVAKGTLYGYVASKEALFDAVVRYSDRPTQVPMPAELPVATPVAGTTVRYIRERMTAEAPAMSLVRIASGALVIEDPREKLVEAVSDLYRRMFRNRFAIKLIDRCAPDYPELAEVWFGDGRGAQHALLVQLIREGIDAGTYRRVVNVEIAARMVLETVAFWALHRHFDPSPQDLVEAEVEEAVIEFLTRALLEERP